MNGYIVNFAVYSFAMAGFILALLFIYKKAVNPCANKNNKNFLEVENMLKLSPVKTIYVIKAGSEKFLIAGDTANTTMLAKLDKDNVAETVENDNVREFPQLKILNKLNRG